MTENRKKSKREKSGREGMQENKKRRGYRKKWFGCGAAFSVGILAALVLNFMEWKESMDRKDFFVFASGEITEGEKMDWNALIQENYWKYGRESEVMWESESESETESELDSESELMKESNSENDSESGLESDSEGKEAFGGKAEMESEAENETVSEHESELEDNSEIGGISGENGELKCEPESEKISEAEGKLESDSESEELSEDKAEMESETGTETGEGSECEDESESETIFAGEDESESETVFAGEDESESETELFTEGIAEAPGEETTKRETEWSFDMETETLTESPAETDLEGGIKLSEEETEGQAEEEETDEQTQTETEEQTEAQADWQIDEQTKVETEEQTEAHTEAQIDWQIDEQTKVETEEQTEAHTEAQADWQTDEQTKTATEEQNEVQTEDQTETQTEEAAESESLPQEIARGVHYEISGDPNAWYRDGNDRLWVRPGSNVYIETKADSGYNRGLGKSNLQEDGVLVFCLQKTDENGVVVAESQLREECYYIDGEAPRAQIQVSGKTEEGIVYAAQETDVTVSIEPDGKSGLKTAAYSIIRCKENGDLTGQPSEGDWSYCEENQKLNLQEEGMFCVFVRTEDQVGNVAFSRSNIICVDHTLPEITVTGVGNQTANSGTVKIQVLCSDEHFRAGSLKINITGANSGMAAKVKKREENAEGVSVEYFDFPREKRYDDVYELQVKAEDLAGNTAETKLEFSVNRFGSVYDLSGDTKQKLSQYFLNEASDITFYETNIDYVGESDIYCRKDGELTKLEKGSDYQVEMKGSKESWKQYHYTVPAKYFRQEGVYELLLSSKDRAENQSDTGMQEKRVTFVLDWTAPGCTVTGIESEKIYDQESVTAYLTPYDNTGMKNMRVYLDSELLQEEILISREPETVRVPLQAASQWQTLQVYLCDRAGNEYWSAEIPVFIGSKGEDVPGYQKLRASAQEREQQKREEELLKTADQIQEKNENGAGVQAGIGIENAEYLQSRKQQKFSDQQDGIILFVLGIFTFVLTAVAGKVTGFGRKK